MPGFTRHPAASVAALALRLPIGGWFGINPALPARVPGLGLVNNGRPGIIVLGLTEIGVGLAASLNADLDGVDRLSRRLHPATCRL